MRVSASATAITYKVAMSTEKSAGVTLTASKTPRRLGPKRDRDRGWVPPWPPSCTRAIPLFDRSDFTRLSPTLSTYRLRSGADSPLEGLSLPWMPRIPASMFIRLYAAIHSPCAGQSGASRVVRGIPKTRDFRTR